ncbi:hypothetical protein BDF19DRAFT_414796 [Syncephalis fuscata]|nr:hypothetical protein BDF19DRAFT_414796 [Syncephalis fuscata]
MAALTDLDFFEPELDDVLFPEALDADYPAPDSGLQWFPELPDSEPMFAEQDPLMGSMVMPSAGLNSDALMMPPTPESDGDEAASYFSPMPVPQHFITQTQGQVQQPIGVQTPESLPSQQNSPASLSPSMAGVANGFASPIGLMPTPTHIQQQQLVLPSTPNMASVVNHNNHSILAPAGYPNSIDANNTGYNNPETSPSLPDLSWSPEAFGSPTEDYCIGMNVDNLINVDIYLPMFPESIVGAPLFAPANLQPTTTIAAPNFGNPDIDHDHDELDQLSRLQTRQVSQSPAMQMPALLPLMPTAMALNGNADSSNMLSPVLPSFQELQISTTEPMRSMDMGRLPPMPEHQICQQHRIQRDTAFFNHIRGNISQQIWQ